MSPRQRYLAVYSIGHSHHSRENFVTLLRQHAIEVVLDVRSSPLSRRAPQFNRTELKQWLAGAGIGYSFGGRALGGRPSDPSLYVHGRANYERMAKTEAFRVGLRRVARAAQSTRLALMCAEGEPLDCHRFLLVSRALSEALELYHILPSGRTESQRETEQRLVGTVGLAQGALFENHNDALKQAYALQAERVAYLLPRFGPVDDRDTERAY